MRTKKVLAVVILVVGLVVALVMYIFRSSSQSPVKVTSIRVARVFMNEPRYFTFLVPQEYNKFGQLQVSSFNTSIVADTPTNQSMSIEYTCSAGEFSRTKEVTCKDIPPNFSSWKVMLAPRLTIHVHSVQDLDGAGWNHGKHGSGQTTVIE